MIRHQNVVASYLVLTKDRKILLMKRYNTGYEDGNYSLIAGHVEKGETFTNAIIRESFEEANIKVKAENLKVIHIMHRKSFDSERVDVFFSVSKWQGKLENKEPHKCSEFIWSEIDEIPTNTVGYIKEALLHIKNNVFYSEFGWS
jgi:8-oxo-dGTP diphosphatase